MGIKSTYRDLVYTQPPSFVKKKEFKIREIVGKGETGKVVRAIWTKSGVKINVALKIVKKEIITNDPTIINIPHAVAREIGMLKSLNHQFIVSFYDSFESKDKYFISLELAPGGNLAGRIQRGRMKEIHARSIIQQVINGVGYLHSLGIVHRDLRPETILFKNTDTTELVISGFGIATKLVFDGEDEDEDEGRVDDFPEWDNEDGLNGYYGTRGYLAPEVLLGFSCQNAKIDSFSIGAILCEMLLCGRPFGDDWFMSGSELLEQVCQHKIIWQERYWGKNSIGDLMTGLLAVDPGVRMSIQQILDHPWVNGNPTQTLGYTNSVFPKSKSNPFGITKWHKTAINAVRARFCQRPLYVTKPHLRTINIYRPHSHSDSNSDSETQSESDSRVDTPQEDSEEKGPMPYKFPAWYRAIQYVAQRA